MSTADRMPSPARPLFGIRYSDVTGLDHARQTIENADGSAAGAFRYVVTPNADHVLRIVERSALRAIYNGAWLCLNDSRVLQLLLRAGGLALPVVRGSDLVSVLLTSQWIRGKRLVVIGGDARVSHWLHSLPGPAAVFHHNPPMGFVETRGAVDQVVDFIARHLPAVVFLAVGSPSQEIVADACVRRNLRGGVAFCIGAGLLMASGIERRAPPALRFAGLEWLYRLARDPRRLAGRYLRDIRILPIVAREVLRGRSVAQ